MHLRFERITTSDVVARYGLPSGWAIIELRVSPTEGKSLSGLGHGWNGTSTSILATDYYP